MTRTVSTGHGLRGGRVPQERRLPRRSPLRRVQDTTYIVLLSLQRHRRTADGLPHHAERRPVDRQRKGQVRHTSVSSAAWNGAMTVASISTFTNAETPTATVTVNLSVPLSATAMSSHLLRQFFGETLGSATSGQSFAWNVTPPPSTTVTLPGVTLVAAHRKELLRMPCVNGSHRGESRRLDRTGDLEFNEVNAATG